MLGASWESILFAAILGSASTLCGAQTEAVPRPDVKVGDTWTFNRTTNHPLGGGFRQARVVQVNDKAIQLVITDGTGKESDETYTPEWNAVAGEFGIFYPNVGLFQFPLQVGASYQFQFELVPTLATNIRSLHAHIAKVVGWEDVQVPAGKYRAVKIETNGTVRRQDGSEGTGHFVVWYVPELRGWAKFVYEEDFRIASSKSRPVLRVVDELIAFKLE